MFCRLFSFSPQNAIVWLFGWMGWVGWMGAVIQGRFARENRQRRHHGDACFLGWHGFQYMLYLRLMMALKGWLLLITLLE